MRIGNHEIKDRILLEKAACQGCSDSLAIIYDKYWAIVHDYLKRAGADGMSEDICQTVFVRLSEGKCNYNTQIAADNYLCAVARNILRDHRKVKTEILYSPKDIELLNIDQLVSVQPDMLEAAEELQLLKTLIAELPSKARQAIRFAFMETGKGGDFIQEYSSISPDVFRMRLRYAIKLIREKFTDT